jgi:ribosomal protein S18 acetylase RimI-like enzyme
VRDVITRLEFSKASKKDISSIVEINNSHVTSDHTGGFLLNKIDDRRVERSLTWGTSNYFVARSNDGLVVGFISFTGGVSESVLEDLTWSDNCSKDMLFHNKHLYIEQVAVRSEYRATGVGTFMYRSLLEIYPLDILTAFIVTKPFENVASTKFHFKNGFKVGGILDRSIFLGMSEFRSLLFVKVPDYRR